MRVLVSAESIGNHKSSFVISQGEKLDGVFWLNNNGLIAIDIAVYAALAVMNYHSHKGQGSEAVGIDCNA